MPTTILDGELLHEAYARRFREEGAQIEREIKMEEMNKAVDTAYAGIRSALIALEGVSVQLERSRALAKATEESNDEYKYAKIAGQLIGMLDVLSLSVEIIDAKLEDAASAARYLKGEYDD